MNQTVTPIVETGRRRRRPYSEVYFIEAEKLGLVKIGWAVNSDQRRSDLQTGSPDKLTLRGILVCDDAPALERKMHKRFAHLRQHGEWFLPDDAMRDYMRDCLFSREAMAIGRIIWCLKPSPPDPGPPDFSFQARAGESNRAMNRRLKEEIEAAFPSEKAA